VGGRARATDLAQALERYQSNQNALNVETSAATAKTKPAQIDSIPPLSRAHEYHQLVPPLQIQRHTETRESSREEPHCDPTDRRNNNHHNLTRPNPTTLPHTRAVISISSPSPFSPFFHCGPFDTSSPHTPHTCERQQATDTLTPPQLISAALSRCWCCRCASSSLPLRPVSHFFRSFGPMRVAGECSLRRWRVARAPPRAPGATATHRPQPCPPPDSGTLDRATCARCSLCSPTARPICPSLVPNPELSIAFSSRYFDRDISFTTIRFLWDQSAPPNIHTP